jgi:PleD family two-component response regulator
MTISAHFVFRSSYFQHSATTISTALHLTGRCLVKLVQRAGGPSSAEHKTKVSFPFAWLMLSNSAAFLEYMSETTGTKPAPDSSPTTSAEICYVVDDDPSMRKSISRLLESEGFKVRDFGDPEDFLNHLAANPARLVILDIWMERMTGMELLAHLCARSPRTRVIFITGHEDRAAEATVMRAGASAFFIKPFDDEKFIAAVRDALKQA